MFFQKEIETMKRSELEALQLERLKWTVDYCYKNVPFYTKKLDEAGISAEKIKSLSDIKYIPPTTKADLRDNYPFGLFARPMKEMVRIHASSGTTGKPTVVGYTKHDLDLWSDCVARIAAAAGATDEDIVQISFGYGMFTGALGLHYGLEKLGEAAFANCEKLSKLVLPESVVAFEIITIQPETPAAAISRRPVGVFDGCDLNVLVLVVARDCAAQKYAAENGIAVRYAECDRGASDAAK